MQIINHKRDAAANIRELRQHPVGHRLPIEVGRRRRRFRAVVCTSGLTDRAQYVGYNYSYLGENIAFNYPDDNSVMIAWMNSPGHRANILNPNFTQMGVGITYDSGGEPYYTQEFGSPA